MQSEFVPAKLPYHSPGPAHDERDTPNADVILGTAQELANVCRSQGIDTLLYLGDGPQALFGPAGVSEALAFSLNPIVVRELLHFPLPAQRQPWETEAYIRAKQIRFVEHFGAPSVSMDELSPSPALQKPQAPKPPIPRVFTEGEVKAYVPIGASARYRHFTLDWNWNGGYLDDYLARVDPVEVAEFLKKVHVDGVVIMSESHHGYTTFLSDNAPSFPSAANRDLYGELIRECHKRGIAVYGFNSLARNWWYSGEHPEMSWIRKAGTKIEPMLDLNSPYLDYQVRLSQEVLTKYPIDALRYDTLQQDPAPSNVWSSKRYRELYGEDLPADWQQVPWRRALDFQRYATSNAAQRLYEGNKRVKSSIEVWQNGFIQQKDFDINNMEAGRFQDMAYIEAGDPFRQLLFTGVLGLKGTIVGHLFDMPSKIQRLCMALGARGYQFKAVNSETLLPDNKEWYYENVAPFYRMIGEIEPYLKDAKAIPYVGVVYAEATRYRSYAYDRDWYVYGILKPLAMDYLSKSRVVEFISNLDLASKDYAHLPLIVLPETSGLTPPQLDGLRRYVRGGGKLLVAGEALRYDEHGAELKDFSLAREMGVSIASAAQGSWSWRTMSAGKDARAVIDVPKPGSVRLKLWMREAGARIDQILLTRDSEFQPNGPQASSNAGIVLEAEDFQKSVPAANHVWRKKQDMRGASGTGSIRAELHQAEMIQGATMDQTKAFRVDRPSEAPAAEYVVNVPVAGKYYVWVRQSHTNQESDSVYIGITPETAVVMDFGNSSHSADGRGTVATVGQTYPFPEIVDPTGLVGIQSTAGRILANVLTAKEAPAPLLHANDLGKGQIYYLATTTDLGLLRAVIDGIAGTSSPVETEKQVILTRQSAGNRWILHLLEEGDYSVTVNTSRAPAKEIVEQYPSSGWSAVAQQQANGLKISTRGATGNRVVVLR